MSPLATPRWFEGVVYAAYGDESADETKQRVFAIAALLGSQNDWDIFRVKWRERTNGKIFHATDCDTDQGDYSRTEHTNNKKLYADLTGLIAESKMIGYGAAINLCDFKELMADKIDENPYYLCFNAVIAFLARRGGVCIPQDRIKFIFDRNKEIEYNAGRLYDHMVNNELIPEYRQWMEDEIGFSTNQEIGIQAADLIAREAMKLLDNRMGLITRPTRRATQVLQDSKRIIFRLFERSWFEYLIHETQEHRFLKSDYSSWLQKKGLTHTLANLIRYQESPEYREIQP